MAESNGSGNSVPTRKRRTSGNLGGSSTARDIGPSSGDGTATLGNDSEGNIGRTDTSSAETNVGYERNSATQSEEPAPDPSSSSRLGRGGKPFVATTKGKRASVKLSALTAKGAEKIFLTLCMIVVARKGAKWIPNREEIEAVGETAADCLEPFPTISHFLSVWASPFLFAGSILTYYLNRTVFLPKVPISQANTRSQGPNIPSPSVTPNAQTNGVPPQPSANYNFEAPLYSTIDN